MDDSRFIVGIDLGTTNIAVTYFDTHLSENMLYNFEIGQLVNFGEFDRKRLLPACALLGISQFTSLGALQLPWSNNDYAIGTIASSLGPEYPLQLVNSAKSWLCHAGVNRRENILPWGVNAENKISPLVVTEYYLKHIVSAWDYQFGKERDKNGSNCFLIDQQVIITIPASFDEVARELTLEAAQNVGFKNIQLLEEPLSVFYAWINSAKKKQILPSDKILVIDIGGGTSDFSIIETNSEGMLSRTISGEHLLLGGDNLDQALAALIEKQWQRKLCTAEWSTLVSKAKEAKEDLLSNELLESVTLSMIFPGSSVVGNTMRATINRCDFEKLLYDGFLPLIEKDCIGAAKGSGFKSLGLPYAKDPAITRQLMSFLRYAAKVSNLEEIFQPTHILFNGGVLKSPILRKRIMQVINSWLKIPAIELENSDYLSAVASGASWFGRSRRGCGVKIKSGTSRSYYIKSTLKDGGDCWVCVMPRGVDENSEIKSSLIFTLTANTKVAFPLYCSSTRINDNVDDIINSDNELTLLTELHTVLTYGKSNEDKVKGAISSKLNYSG
ncbi:MAG: Hsp70 family protein, partial [Lentisphaeria bacterium]